MSAAVAVLSAVLTSKVTPPAGAGCDRLIVKVYVVVPLLPSACDTSLMVSEGVGVAVGVAVAVAVPVAVAVGVGLGVPVAVAVAVAVGVGVDPAEHGANVLAVLRGFGVPVLKSDELLSVSTHPPDALKSAVVLLGAGAGAVPSKQLAVVPNPTRSMMLAPVGHAPLRAVVEFTSATLPAVAPIAIDPLASGVGRFTVPPVPAASWTR